MTAPAPAEPIYDWALETDHLDSLMDGDARCQVPECGALATHALTHHGRCPFPLCPDCVHRNARRLADAGSLCCSGCGTRGFTVADIQYRPI